jgi:hypothetical protein
MVRRYKKRARPISELLVECGRPAVRQLTVLVQGARSERTVRCKVRWRFNSFFRRCSLPLIRLCLMERQLPVGGATNRRVGMFPQHAGLPLSPVFAYLVLHEVPSSLMPSARANGMPLFPFISSWHRPQPFQAKILIPEGAPSPRRPRFPRPVLPIGSLQRTPQEPSVQRKRSRTENP